MARVLVIDDDELFVKLMVQALKQRGHDVEFALDGRVGSEAFVASRFDVVVCDLVMPHQEGFETIRKMRRERPDIGIVAISGGLTVSTAKIDILRMAEQFGADVTLSKPFKLSELVVAVDTALATPRPTAELTRT